MKRYPYHFGADLERRPVVLPWRFVTPKVKDKAAISEPQVPKKAEPSFGRRTMAPAG
jgi:hypothetical protein